MSQTELGRRLGLDQSAVSRIEGAMRELTARELALATTALGVTAHQLLVQAPEAPALLRAGEADQPGVVASLDILNACIDEYRGVEALAG